MSRVVFVRRRAQEELAASAAWYDEPIPNFGAQFLSAVAATIERIVAMPASNQAVEHGVRRALVRRFPFGVFDRFDDGRFQLRAVLHQARHPRDRR